TNSAYSSPNSWDINLNTAYANQARSILTSPLFDFSTAQDVRLSFFQNWDCESNWDGVKLEYSINGTPWTVLGDFGDTNATNWYNFTNINSNPGPAWSGSSNGWIK